MSEIRVDKITNNAGTGPVEFSNGFSIPPGATVTGFVSGVGIENTGTLVGTGATILDFRGTAISSVSVSSGIGTINLTGADLTSVSEDITPLFDGVFDIGSPQKRWYDVYVENSINFLGNISLTSTLNYNNEMSLTLDSDFAANDVVVDSLLAGDILISDNIITPDDSTARQYSGSQGVAIVDGNLDVQGDWIKVPVVESVIVPGTTTIIPGVGSWSFGGNLPMTYTESTGTGTQNAALSIGGYASFSHRSETYQYNGTSWNGGGNLIVSRYRHGAAGTQNAALACGGHYNFILSSTEEYNGSFWSSGGNLLLSTLAGGATGIQDAALLSGGEASGGYISISQEYNGTSWSYGGIINQNRSFVATVGTQNAALLIGGVSPNFQTLTQTEEYDGTSWSIGGSMITGRMALTASGTQDAALAIAGRISTFGGFYDDSVSSTEKYNGTSWSTAENLNQTRSHLGGAGTQSEALAFGGYQRNTTEEYNISADTVTTTPDQTISSPLTTGEVGHIRFNKDTNKFEGYDGTQWVSFY